MSKYTEIEEQIIARVTTLCAAKGTAMQRALAVVCSELVVGASSQSFYTRFQEYERVARELAYKGWITIQPEDTLFEVVSLPSSDPASR